MIKSLVNSSYGTWGLRTLLGMLGIAISPLGPGNTSFKKLAAAPPQLAKARDRLGAPSGRAR